MPTFSKWMIAVAVTLIFGGPLVAEAQLSGQPSVESIKDEMRRNWGDVRGETRLGGRLMRLLRQAGRTDSPQEIDSVADLLVDLTVAHYGVERSDVQLALERIRAATALLVQSGETGNRLRGVPYPGAASALLRMATSLPEGTAFGPLHSIVFIGEEAASLAGLREFALSGRSDSHMAIVTLKVWIHESGGAHAGAEEVLLDLHGRRDILSVEARRELDMFAQRRGWPIPGGP